MFNRGSLQKLGRLPSVPLRFALAGRYLPIANLQLYMKLFAQNLSLIAGFACLALLPSGCSTPKAVSSADSAASSMQSLADNLEKGRAQVAATMTALNEVVISAADPKKAYSKFSSEVGALNKAATNARERSDKMKATVKEHYALWDQELAAISNPDLKQQSVTRKAEVSKAFEDIKNSFVQVSITFKPYQKDLQDLNRYLATDLSAKGIAGASGTIGKLKTESVAVQRDIQAAATKIKELQASMGKLKK